MGQDSLKCNTVQIPISNTPCNPCLLVLPISRGLATNGGPTPEHLHCVRTLINEQHLREERLQTGIFTNHGNVRQCLAHLTARSLPGEACSNHLPRSTPQSQAWLVPEPDACLVKGGLQNSAARRQPGPGGNGTVSARPSSPGKKKRSKTGAAFEPPPACRKT